jgi:hypothetical protein
MSLPSQSHLHPRRWVAPLAAFTMAITLGLYVRAFIRQARRERDRIRANSTEETSLINNNGKSK